MGAVNEVTKAASLTDGGGGLCDQAPIHLLQQISPCMIASSCLDRAPAELRVWKEVRGEISSRKCNQQ